MPDIVSNVADSLFELGKGVVKGTTGALADIASGSVEQLAGSPAQAGGSSLKVDEDKKRQSEEKKATEKRRLEEVKGDLSRYIERKKQLDQRIADEQVAQGQQEKREDVQKKGERDSWIKKMINRSQTGTEKGRLTE